MTLTQEKLKEIRERVILDPKNALIPLDEFQCKLIEAGAEALLSKLAGVTDGELQTGLEDKLALEMITVGTCIDDSKTGQMFRFDAERLSKISISCVSAVHNAQMQKAVEEALSKHCRNCNLFLKNTKVFKGG